MYTLAALTVDLLVLVGAVFNGTDIQTGLVWKEQASRFLQVGGAQDRDAVKYSVTTCQTVQRNQTAT